jgi:hypothetical protein
LKYTRAILRYNGNGFFVTMRRIACFTLLLITGVCSAQADDVLKTLNSLGRTILDAKTDAEKLAANSKFTALLKDKMMEGRSFNDLDSLKTVFQFTAPDKSFRIVNWNMPLGNGTWKYFGLVQSKAKTTKKKQETNWILTELVDKSDEIVRPENTVCEFNNWFGAQYYKMIVTRYKKKTFYTLLGIDWNDKLSRKKIVDVISFDNKSRPRFGSNIFKASRVFRQRYIFEYTAKATMTLNYDERENRIVFDHLSPPSENLVGNYQFYGPDGSFDYLFFEKGKWVYVNDLDARNRKTKADKNYNAPVEPKLDK